MFGWHGLGAGRGNELTGAQGGGGEDLDSFLDNYLVQLHAGNPEAQAQARNRVAVPDLSLLGHGNALAFGAQPQQLQGFNLGYAGLGLPQGLNLTSGNPLSGLAVLQQQQQQQQLQQLHQQQQLQQLQQQQHQQQLQHQALHLGPGGVVGPSASALLGGVGLLPPPQQQQGGKAGPSGGGGGNKAPRGKGKGGGKQQQQAQGQGGGKPEESVSGGSDSDGEGGTSDEEPRNRKRQATGGAMDDAERRHQALQEKNRRAQRRFRERQKTKLQELHKQIDELTTKVGTLQSENASLYSRTNILEKVLDMRNEQIQVMQETKEAAGYLENDPASLQGVGGHLVQLTPENIKELGSDQIFKIYQLYVKELSVRLMEGTDKLQELEVLVQDLCSMVLRLGVIKPLETRKFIVMSRQCLGSTEGEVIELWKNVMKSIDLTEQQKREVLEMKRGFLQKIDPIMEERKQLNMQIQSNLPHDTFATKNALTYIKAHEAVIKLRDNLRTEQRIVLEFAMTVFREVFKPTQMAALLVKCYPAVPDALGIASALAADLGEPDMPNARHLTMQLGGYLEGSSLASNGTAAGISAPSTANPSMAMGGVGMGMGVVGGGGGGIGVSLESLQGLMQGGGGGMGMGHGLGGGGLNLVGLNALAGGGGGAGGLEQMLNNGRMLGNMDAA